MSSTLLSRREPGAESHYEDIFFYVVAFGDLADYTTQSLAKGDQVTVFGHLEDPDVSDPGHARPWRKMVATEIDVNLGRLFVGLEKVARGPTGWRPRT